MSAAPSGPARLGAVGGCVVCGHELAPFLRGDGGVPDPESFRPTNHRPGSHGDLVRCTACDAVQQPALPSGEALHDLYRAMEDDAYLDEDAGRRATARRLLGHLGVAPPGRLLDVGCGHGLLLDEARRLGFTAEGIELSSAAVAHARDRLGLEVRQLALEDLDPADGRYDAIVLADVIEHLADPVAALDRCVDLLAPGGALCVVTPDPASRTARLAGGRWWGYVPAHTCLLPRRTLLELLTARGLTIGADVPLVRTFTLRTWLGGLVERAGALAPLAAASRRLPLDRSLSLSLGDERVVVARRVEVRRPGRPLVRPRGGPHDVHAVLPAYRAARTVQQVADELPDGAVDRVLLVDDASPDDTVERALEAGFEVLAHPANRGYGANQKTCYVRSLLDGADVVVMVHADNQYDPSLVRKLTEPIERGEADVVIGSRLLKDEAIAGGMPRWKWLGNRGLTWVENRAFGTRYSEFHTGYRAFSAAWLRTVPFLRNADGFVFDQEIFAQAVAGGARVREIEIPTRYFLEASSVDFTTSVEYGLRTLAVLARFRLHRRGVRWSLLAPPAAAIGDAAAAGRDDADASRLSAAAG